MSNEHVIPAGYFTYMYFDEKGNRKWRLYDGQNETGKLVAEGLEFQEVRRKWEEYKGTKGMRRRY